MLVLTIKEGGRLMIADDITVRVLKVNGRQVKMGIEAPKDIPVHREEIYERIKNGVEQEDK